MTTLAHRVVRQRGFLVALASGLVVLAVNLVQNVLNAVIGQLSFLGTSGVPAWQWWAGYAAQFASIAVPLALGVVLSFWFIAPIGPDLHIAHVVTRAALAAAVGSGLVFLVNLVTTGISLVTNGLMGQIRLTADAGDKFLQALGWRSNFLVNLGHGDSAALHPRVWGKVARGLGVRAAGKWSLGVARSMFS